MPQEPEKAEKCEVGERESSVQYGGVMCIRQGGNSRL